MNSTVPHYEQLAGEFDRLWTHSEGFVAGMTDAIVQHLDPRADHDIVDLGGGTGLYAKVLDTRIRPLRPILVADPSESMMSGLSQERGFKTMVGDGDEFVSSGLLVDRVLIKEAVHHFPDPVATLTGLSGCLRPGGRILIVMLPPTIDYPLFDEALRRFETLQPHYMEVAQALASANLEVEVAHHTFSVELPASRYVEMVENRYMSLLSDFSDDELTAGITEMKLSIGDAYITIPDHFVFVTGSSRGG